MQNPESEILFHQVPMQVSQGKADSVPSLQPPKVEAYINAEKEIPIDPTNADSKVVQPSNVNSNRFKSYWKPVSHRKFSTSGEKPLTAAVLRDNYKSDPRRDGRRLPPKFNKRQTRFVVPPPIPQNKQWRRVEYQKFP